MPGFQVVVKGGFRRPTGTLDGMELDAKPVDAEVDDDRPLDAGGDVASEEPVVEPPTVPVVGNPIEPALPPLPGDGVEPPPPWDELVAEGDELVDVNVRPASPTWLSLRPLPLQATTPLTQPAETEIQK
jgi:hypothetical protein